MAIAFGVLRAFGGWVIGIPLFFVLMEAVNTVTAPQLIATFAIPRFAPSAFLVHVSARVANTRRRSSGRFCVSSRHQQSTSFFSATTRSNSIGCEWHGAELDSPAP